MIFDLEFYITFQIHQECNQRVIEECNSKCNFNFKISVNTNFNIKLNKKLTIDFTTTIIKITRLINMDCYINKLRKFN